MLKLTDSKVKAAKGLSKPYKLYDGRGLLLNVTPAGGKHWRLKYRIGGREHTASLGSYPEVGLAAARERASAARTLVGEGIHPLAHKKAMQAAKSADAQATFGAVVAAWIDANTNAWAPYTLSQVRSFMGRYVLGNASLANKPIRSVTSRDIRDLLQSIAVRTAMRPGERKTSGSITIARNVRTWCGGVFQFAIERDLADVDPTYALRNLTELKRPPGSIRHNKKLAPNELQLVIDRIKKFTGTRQVGIALELLLHCFVRTKELRLAEWTEVDFKAAQWRIPASRMKAKKPHLVPLSKQALALFEELHAITGVSGRLFPNQRRLDGHMCATTINRALERMELNGPETIGLAAHGFRGTASTHLHELGFSSEVIEIQLSHSERDKVKASYSEAKYVKARTEMMQSWSDYLVQVEKSGLAGHSGIS